LSQVYINHSSLLENPKICNEDKRSEFQIDEPEKIEQIQENIP